MNKSHRDRTATSFLTWLRWSVVSFVIAAICGGACIPAGHYQIYADVDPFNHGWPLYLHATAFLSAFIIALLLRRPIASALGLYAGLVGIMLASGESEYPMSSAIALAVHGLTPAAFGSAFAFVLLSFTSSRVPGKKAASKAVNHEGGAGAF